MKHGAWLLPLLAPFAWGLRSRARGHRAHCSTPRKHPPALAPAEGTGPDARAAAAELESGKGYDPPHARTEDGIAHPTSTPHL